MLGIQDPHIPETRTGPWTKRHSDPEMEHQKGNEWIIPNRGKEVGKSGSEKNF
jgi:hypothetical protein